jgi:sugar/nucleoside kinase (ribokinase family)
VTVDVVCAGPVFLDLTFDGLEALPGPGEERYARDLHATPGGVAITAIGLVRLGLRAAVVWPVGGDLAGRMVRERLEAEGVVCAGPSEGRTAVTAVLPVDGERSFATFDPGATVDPDVIAGLRPRAVVAGLDDGGLAPPGALLYAVVGDRDADRFAGSVPPTGARALIANRSEAARLTGQDDPEGAALALAESVETAVVTCGAEGAVAVSAGESVAVPAPAVEARDTTGAGDLFVAAYVWGDLEGLPLEERLRRAVVYAALSVRKATGADGAPARAELERFLAGAIV